MSRTEISFLTQSLTPCDTLPHLRNEGSSACHTKVIFIAVGEVL